VIANKFQLSAIFKITFLFFAPNTMLTLTINAAAQSNKSLAIESKKSPKIKSEPSYKRATAIRALSDAATPTEFKWQNMQYFSLLFDQIDVDSGTFCENGGGWGSWNGRKQRIGYIPEISEYLKKPVAPMKSSPKQKYCFSIPLSASQLSQDYGHFGIHSHPVRATYPGDASPK
jgi:hypothetical protein